MRNSIYIVTIEGKTHICHTQIQVAEAVGLSLNIIRHIKEYPFVQVEKPDSKKPCKRTGFMIEKVKPIQLMNMYLRIKNTETGQEYISDLQVNSLFNKIDLDNNIDPTEIERVEFDGDSKTTIITDVYGESVTLPKQYNVTVIA